MNLTHLEMVLAKAHAPNFSEGPYGEIRRTLWKVVPPIFIFLGLAGNALTVLVLLRRFRKLSSMSIYLLALTLSNTVILLSGPLRNWIHSVWETDIRYLSDTGCKVQLYLTYASIHISAWLLVAVTWERTLVMLYPMKALATFTARNTAAVILGISIVISAIDLIVPAMVTLHGVNNLLCAPKTKEWLHFRDSIYEWIDFFLMFAAPIVFLFVGNAIIIFKLQLQRKKIKKMCTFVEKNTASGQGHTSVLVVALSYMYVVTITPVSVYHVYFVHRLKQIQRKFRQDPRGALEEFEFALLLQTIFYIWSYLNVTFNFALYVISGSRFRNDLLEMLQWKKTSKAPESHDPDVATVGRSSDNGSVMQSNYSLEVSTSAAYCIADPGSTPQGRDVTGYKIKKIGRRNSDRIEWTETPESPIHNYI